MDYDQEEPANVVMSLLGRVNSRCKVPRWRSFGVFHIKEATVTGIWLVRGGKRDDVVREVSRHSSHWVVRPL